MKNIDLSFNGWDITLYEDGEVMFVSDYGDETLVLTKEKMEEIIEAYQKLC